MNTNLLSMFLTFAKIGAFTLGGGYAMVPIMEREIVDRKSWLTREEFMDILIVAQSTPGLFAINMAIHIGNKARGVVGGIVVSLGVALPSIVTILVIAMFFRAFKDNVYIAEPGCEIVVPSKKQRNPVNFGALLSAGTSLASLATMVVALTKL